MQTSITDFLERDNVPETLSLAAADCPLSAPKKRSRDTDHTDTYPLRSCFSRRAAAHLRLIDARLFSRHHTRLHCAVYFPLPACFHAHAPPQVFQVSSSMHPNRSNEDGESLISSVDTFKNCITEIVWDPKDEFFIATRRSRFQLFGASSVLDRNEEQRGNLEPLLNLKSSTVQTRLSAENRISFGLTNTQFLGNTLNTICTYSGAPHVDVFDLEDLDEATGEPLCSFNLSSIFERDAQGVCSTSPSATAVVSLSNTLAIAALSNGSCAYIDTRTGKPSVCTRAPLSSDIINTYGSPTGRTQKQRCNSAIDVVTHGGGLQLVSGTKSGLVELWDLRMCSQPAASSCVGGAVEKIKVACTLHSSRCGAPTLWLNTDAGELLCLAIGATSFETISQVKTNDTRRSRSSANLAPPKLSFTAQNSVLVYPHVASNTILFYEVNDSSFTSKPCAGSPTKLSVAQRKEVNSQVNSAGGDFRSARSLLLQQEAEMNGEMPSFCDSAARMRNPHLVRSFAFDEWSPQISSAAMANRHDVVAVGGDDGDIHLIIDSDI